MIENIRKTIVQKSNIGKEHSIDHLRKAKLSDKRFHSKPANNLRFKR